MLFPGKDHLGEGCFKGSPGQGRALWSLVHPVVAPFTEGKTVSARSVCIEVLTLLLQVRLDSEEEASHVG